MERSRWIEFLINRYSKPLVRYATGLLKDRDAAREIVQQCLLQLLQQETPIARESTQAWLYRECRSRCLDGLRKSAKPGASVEPAVFVDPPYESEALTFSKPSPVMKAVKDLSPRHQEIFWLKYRDGLSYSEIGEVLNLTPGHVGTVLFECTKTLGPFVSGQESRFANETLDKAKWMALIHNQADGGDRQTLMEQIQADENIRLENEELVTFAKALEQNFSDRAQDGLSPAQLAGLHAKAPARPVNWAGWAAGFSFVTAVIAGVLLYLPQPHEANSPEDSRAPAAVREEPPTEITNVPVELQKEFAPSGSTPAAAPAPQETPPPPHEAPHSAGPRHVTVVKALTKVPASFNKQKVHGYIGKQLQGENACIPGTIKHKELTAVFEVSKTGAVTGFHLKTKLDGGKKISDCLKKKLSGKTDAFKNTAKGPTKFTITLRL